VFQEYVPKHREIRAVVIGGRVFAAFVDSQSIPAARDDVRGAGEHAGYKPYRLPEGVRAVVGQGSARGLVTPLAVMVTLS
jgi:glutathione synthase/RimK-type ligase-like ATP-grasp enzyme